MKHNIDICFYPGGTRKVITFSIDDGHKVSALMTGILFGRQEWESTSSRAFYRTDYFYGDDEFTLMEMTDDYKEEWEANSNWLKIAFHAKQEFSDYPYVNINYADMRNSVRRFYQEVIRFAREKTLSTEFNPHGSPVSKEGVIYFRDTKDAAIQDSLCGYNHISTEEYERTLYTLNTICNEEADIYFKHFWNSSCLNLSKVDEIEVDMQKALGSAYVCCAIHEQYSYPNYFAYQPESRDKLMKMCETFEKHGYQYIFVVDLVK